MGKWSKELIEITRDILYNMPFKNFISPEGCYMKNIDGIFGSISLENAMNNNWVIHITKGEEVNQTAKFDSIDSLISAGWVVD